MYLKRLNQLNKDLFELNHEYNIRWWNYSALGYPLITADLIEKKRKIYDNDSILNALKNEINKNSIDDLHFRRISLFLRQFYLNRVELDNNIDTLKHEITEDELTFEAAIDGKTYAINEIRLLSNDFANSKLQNEAKKILETLNERKKGKFLEIISLRNEISRNLGFANYSDIFFFGINPGLEDCLDLIENTVTAYTKIAKEWEAWIKNISGEQGLHEGIRKIQDELDNYYDTLNPQDTLIDLLKSWGLEELFHKIHIFTANDLPNKKHWWTFCLPISIPDDIRISINNNSSFEFLETFYHEMGHAIHYASIDQDEWIFKKEDLMTEIPASILTNICMENEWIARNLKIKDESLIEKIKKVNITRDPVTILSRCLDFQLMLSLYKGETDNPDMVFDELYKRMFSYREQISTAKPRCNYELYYTEEPFYGLYHLLGEIKGKKIFDFILHNYDSFFCKEVGELIVKKLFKPGNSIDWLKRIKI